jgi:hypothetical protein
MRYADSRPVRPANTLRDNQATEGYTTVVNSNQ